MSKHSHFERDFWGTCANSFGEETKQILYMREMGFPLVRDWRSAFNFDFGGRSVIDIGGGPVSVLLKRVDDGASWVVDPMFLPEWARRRYVETGVVYIEKSGETFTKLRAMRDDEGKLRQFDVGLIYNCLQHVDDPAKVITNALRVSKTLRMFEWIDIPPHEGHPHMLTQSMLEEATGQRGVVKQFYGEYECTGRAWILGGG